MTDITLTQILTILCAFAICFVGLAVAVYGVLLPLIEWAYKLATGRELPDWSDAE
jgi:hypothetical protein